MSLKEYREGSGIYQIPVSELPAQAWFIRDRDKVKAGELAPLLHVCERDLDFDVHTPTYVVITQKVRWDQRGWYFCQGCKERWQTEDELRAVWEDGLGTGDEGHA